MPHVEYSDTERKAEKVWAGASSYFVAKENHRRRSAGLPELRTKGLPDSLRSDRQVAWDEEARVLDRVRIAEAEALLLEVRSKLAK